MIGGRWNRDSVRRRCEVGLGLIVACAGAFLVCAMIGLAIGLSDGAYAKNGLKILSDFAEWGAPTTQYGVPVDQIGEYSLNRIIFFTPCAPGGNTNIRANGCSKLAELRQAMWNEADEKEKRRFMNVVHKENAGLAAIESYMNRAIALDNGNLKEWLDGNNCHGFMHNSSICDGEVTISDEDNVWIQKALGGSNVTNVATGNSSWSKAGGDAGTGGPLTCLWVKGDNEDGGECKSDIDYSQSPYNKSEGGNCSEMIQAAGGDIDSGWECWSWDGTEKWSKSMASQCAGSNSVGSANVTSAGVGTGADSTITWDKEGWITGGMDGYTKEESERITSNKDEYESGKPNKILLHFTEGMGGGLGAYGLGPGVAAHFTIDLLKKEVHQHVPIGRPSGAAAGDSDKYDVVQIEIVGYGFEAQNPDNPGPDSKCIIYSSEEHKNVDYTDNEYCFAKFGDAEWGYLAKLLKGISKWGSQNGTTIPLTSSVEWTGDVGKKRLGKSEFDKTSGIVGHMHIPNNDHKDPGNIWPLVQAALGTVQCDLNGNENSISGAKNAEKQANEVGPMTFNDNDNESMKKILENYGDLAYRTGQAYGVPWVALLVQGRYEDATAACGSNNFWGIACVNGSKEGEGANLANLGEGFKEYGKTLQQERYKDAVKETDPYEYLVKLGEAGWRVDPATNKAGYAKDWLKNVNNSLGSLTKYMETDEGKQILAQFGATGCETGNDECTVGGDNTATSGSEAILAAIEKIFDLAAKNGSSYPRGANGGSTGGMRTISEFDKILNENAHIKVDCSGFASLVYYTVYGDDFEQSDVITSGSILNGMPSYKEVSKSEVRPGDIFAYSGHVGIVTKVENGKVVEVAETNHKGDGKKNKNIGYTKNKYRMTDSGTHFYRWKGDNT